MMTEVLRAYAAFDPDVGYGQGMSDMLAVLLYTLEDAALSFWCDGNGTRPEQPENALAVGSVLCQSESWVRLCAGVSLP